MTQEEYNWYINLVKDRHHILDLTTEQAEKVYRYEQDRDRYTDKYYFSTWEEWDYEYMVFKEILNSEQFAIYQNRSTEMIANYEQRLIEDDATKTNAILYNQELIEYYENILLPSLFGNPYIGFTWLLKDGGKIEYLKSEYRQFLINNKKEIIINQCRHHKAYKPNELKLSLLMHRLSCLLPDYSAFRNQADDPTKAICEYLAPKIKFLPEETEQWLATQFKALNDFAKTIHNKYYDQVIGGWTIEIKPPSEDELRENRTMMLLLLDKEAYGY